MHHHLSVVPLPARAANIEGMDVTIVAPDARRAATFAATAATLALCQTAGVGFGAILLVLALCHTRGPIFVTHFIPHFVPY